MSDRRYDPKQIEPRWQELWARERTWEVSNDPADHAPGVDKSYVLEMLPYPSGEPHIGHLKNYALGDAIAHFHRRTGHRVLHPMGYDAFGLPAENNAIKTGIHPREATDRSIARLPPLVSPVGDLDRLVARVRHPRAELLPLDAVDLPAAARSAGLAYRKEAAVKWCPHDQTVLANEQVIDGRCERCGHQVELRQLEQWFFRITDYADRLLDDLDAIDWPEHVKAMQRNWIGRSEGAEVTFRCEDLDPATHRLLGLHHPSRHAVRRHLLRHGPGAPRRVPAGGREPSTSRPSTTTSTVSWASRSRSAATPTSPRPACRSAVR